VYLGRQQFEGGAPSDGQSANADDCRQNRSEARVF
jgi:hypothetical protein